jgi:flagellar assembly factor FliW
MQIETTRFGLLPIDESQVITFPEGLPGFEKCRKFTFVQHPGSDGRSPFQWIQSVEDGSLAFLAVEPHVIFPTYAPRLPKSELDSLYAGGPVSERPKLYSILTVPKGDPEGITANLLAPVVVNVRERVAKQIVATGEEYGLRHRLVPN